MYRRPVIVAMSPSGARQSQYYALPPNRPTVHSTGGAGAAAAAHPSSSSGKKGGGGAPKMVMSSSPMATASPMVVVSSMAPDVSMTRANAATVTSVAGKVGDAATPTTVNGQNDVNMTPIIVSSVIGGTMFLAMCVLCAWWMFTRIRRDNRRYNKNRGTPLDTYSVPSNNRSWSSLGSAASSQWDKKPPGYLSNHEIKAPPPSYPHNDHIAISPTHTLVDTTILATHHLPKDDANTLQRPTTPSHGNNNVEPRRSIQPYQAQLTLSASSPFLADDIEPPGPYETFFSP
ncbi:hypothetical protein BC940DRAFT_304696 [Gongronella butleri]|nr:hypothetical protein BC940DRAFT_304696 [Gongronella butleri]